VASKITFQLPYRPNFHNYVKSFSTKKASPPKSWTTAIKPLIDDISSRIKWESVHTPNMYGQQTWCWLFTDPFLISAAAPLTLRWSAPLHRHRTRTRYEGPSEARGWPRATGWLAASSVHGRLRRTRQRHDSVCIPLSLTDRAERRSLTATLDNQLEEKSMDTSHHPCFSIQTHNTYHLFGHILWTAVYFLRRLFSYFYYRLPSELHDAFPNRLHIYAFFHEVWYVNV
jgi:hypothetical protein